MATKARSKKKAPVKQDPKLTYVDKAIELVKWIDTPWKLFEVIILAVMVFGGYFAWDSRQVILNAITQSSHIPKLKEIDAVLPIAQRLQKDLDALTVIVYRAALVVNSRTTMVAIGPHGQDKIMDGISSSLFSQDKARNTAMIAMLNGEVQCSQHEVSGKSTEWEAKQGVKFICRGSIPPEMGAFEGYIAVGFGAEPQDLASVKTRINQASADMAK